MNKWFAGCGNVKLYELHKNRQYLVKLRYVTGENNANGNKPLSSRDIRLYTYIHAYKFSPI